MRERDETVALDVGHNEAPRARVTMTAIARLRAGWRGRGCEEVGKLADPAAEVACRSPGARTSTAVEEKDDGVLDVERGYDPIELTAPKP